MTAAELVQKHEGCRLVPYTDTPGHVTVGWGHNCDAMPLDPSLYLPDGSITQETADSVFSDDLVRATVPLINNCTPWYQSLGPVRQAVLQDLSFNMGWPTLSTFKTFLGCVSAGNYQAAADDLLGTLWARQVGIRATEDAALMASGAWV